RLHVHLAYDGRQAVVGLGEGVGRERIRLDDVGPGVEVRAVDGEHDVRPGQVQQLVVTAYVGRVVSEALPAEVGLFERVALDERAHRAVEDQDPLAKRLVQPGQAARAVEGGDGRAVGRGGHTRWRSRVRESECSRGC